MKFAVLGAGAVGAFIAAKLARAGIDVTLIARGRQLAAIGANGVRVIRHDGQFDFSTPVKVARTAAEAGPADVVILAVKSHQLPEAVPGLEAAFHATTAVVTTQNGIPWWYFQQDRSRLAGLQIERLDPGGVLSRSIPAERIVGSLIYFATEVVEPGVIRHVEGNRMPVGEPSETRSERCRQIAASLIQAGLRAPVVSSIRKEIWVKLIGNLAFNPISALTGATLQRIASDPAAREVALEVMLESEAVANALGVELPISVDQRLEGASRVGHHKTSMLQDLEAGRPLELEALVEPVIELAQILGIQVPRTKVLFACTKLSATIRQEKLGE